MDDSELTKKAIEELLGDMNDANEKNGVIAERKKNPLGKPNKRFLGRTIHSVMKHNKRQIDSNRERCKRKLRKLDDKQRKHAYKQTRKIHKEIKTHSEVESTHEVISSDSEEENRKRKKKKQKSSLSSSNSTVSSSSSEKECSDSTIPSKVKNRKTNRRFCNSNNEGYEEEFCSEMTQYDPCVPFYIDPHIAYAAMAYGHINQILQQQMVQQQAIKNELDDSVEIPSDLSLSNHSESSINISVHSSSAEEDENGILTFKLLSSDEENEPQHLKKVNARRKQFENDNNVTLIESDDDDQSSLKSYISLESTTSQITKKEDSEILLLSSSTSDCDEVELIETVSECEYTKSNIDEIENISNANKDSITEKLKQEEEIGVQSIEAEEVKELEEVNVVQIDKPINENEIEKKIENTEESGKNTEIIREHSENYENNASIKTVVDKESEKHNEEIKDENKDINNGIPEMIDLTEEVCHYTNL